jgi:hypothetical protein
MQLATAPKMNLPAVIRSGFIYLREFGSPQSKPVDASNAETGK